MNDHWVRNDQPEFIGMIRANFMRGKGDAMGVSGHLNDGHDATAPVMNIGQMILDYTIWLVMFQNG